MGRASVYRKPVSQRCAAGGAGALPRAQSGMTVLHIGDDRASIHLCSACWNRKAALCSPRARRAAALDILDKQTPDVILLDLLLPERDGFSIAEELRQDPRWQQIPILVVTGKQLEATDHARLQGHVEKILQKGSYTKADLLRTLRALKGTLPRAQVPNRSPEKSRSAMAKVLIVGDNELNMDMLRRRLTPAGFQVVTAADGAIAVSLAHAEQPDIILMDLSLPVLDGWAATRLLKADPTLRSVPVIALTAHAMREICSKRRRPAVMTLTPSRWSSAGC